MFFYVTLLFPQQDQPRFENLSEYKVILFVIISDKRYICKRKPQNLKY